LKDIIRGTVNPERCHETGSLEKCQGRGIVNLERCHKKGQ
jgi:hypothetical protein